jgi:ribonuclease HIII
MNNKQKTFVFKVSDNLKDEIIKHYQDTIRPKKPPYSVFQADDGCGTVVTLYESGKIMFQGVSADIDYSLWRDREAYLNKRNVDKEINDKKSKDEKKKQDMNITTYKYVSTIGSDEVGTGDYFGPIVVTASFVSKENMSFLDELGVRDSKKLTDKKILEIAPIISKKIPFVSYTLTPKEYNQAGITNMNKVKAILHNKVLYNLVHRDNYDYKYIVVDQFSLVSKYYEHISDIKNKVTNIDFTTHAEDKCLSVAVSSIISRYIFLKKMEELSKIYGEIPKGAGNNVDEFGKEIVKKYGLGKLYELAKLNFKNTDKIKKLVNED